jgi:hypothetical protein
MGPTQEQTFRGVSNQFNTLADHGERPFGLQQIRSRVAADLLFVEQVYVQAISLLCNPATRKFTDDPKSFLNGLLAEGRIVPILSDETPTFSALADRLAAIQSAAIPTSGQTLAEITGMADRLDARLSSIQTIRVGNAQIDLDKTKISKQLVADLPGIVPVPPELHQKIAASASRELEQKGVITGTWWVNLGKELGLIWMDRFTELASFVSDFPYARAFSMPLVGHSYEQDMDGVAALARPFLPKYRLEISDDFFESRDLDPILGDIQVFARMDLDSFEYLTVETQAERRRYYRGLAQFRQHGTEQELLEAKERLDEYLIALARHINSAGLAKFVNARKAGRRVQSRIVLTEIANGVVCSFAVSGAGYETVTGALPHSVQGWLVAVGLASGAAQVVMSLRKVKANLDARKQAVLSDLDSARPVSIQISSMRTPPALSRNQ